jgi:hypothetical protein
MRPRTLGGQFSSTSYQLAVCCLLQPRSARDGQRIPGEIVFHYPLRQAIADDIYKPVRPVVVDLPAGATRQDADRRVAQEVLGTFGSQEHSTSTLLIRASTIARAKELAALYSDLGLEVTVLASRGMTSQQRDSTIAKLHAGEIRAVAVVDISARASTYRSFESRRTTTSTSQLWPQCN